MAPPAQGLDRILGDADLVEAAALVRERVAERGAALEPVATSWMVPQRHVPRRSSLRTQLPGTQLIPRRNPAEHEAAVDRLVAEGGDAEAGLRELLQRDDPSATRRWSHQRAHGRKAAALEPVANVLEA